METPDNEAGRETEAVMAALRGDDWTVPADVYNRCYEAVYALLRWRETKGE